ncbi:MAG: class I SAM-dependent methyltransferase [Erythrobacter sp.]|nr:class I SAM-dependent methyltransferase [Erythrobacter sp.]
MSVLSKSEARALYDRIASRYDLMLVQFKLLGLERHRRRLIRQLDLRCGDTVVDLCCGTGVNFEYLQNAVGSKGRIIGVDLSSAMLEQAQAKIYEAGWKNIEVICADVEKWPLPERTDVVLSTFGLEMVPGYADVIKQISSSLEPGARFGLMGLKKPDRWPDWLVRAAIWLSSPFGVSREYEDFQPWKAARRYLRVRNYRTMLMGAAYSCVAVKNH